MWEDARPKLAASSTENFNRWSADHPVCAYKHNNSVDLKPL